jgi:hypothetical protein
MDFDSLKARYIRTFESWELIASGLRSLGQTVGAEILAGAFEQARAHGETNHTYAVEMRALGMKLRSLEIQLDSKYPGWDREFWATEISRRLGI